MTPMTVIVNCDGLCMNDQPVFVSPGLGQINSG
jgi:hypothetical protein